MCVASTIVGQRGTGEPGRLDLSGKRNRRLTEQAVKAGLIACALVTLLTTVGIVVILVVEALRFFADIPVRDFLTGTKWTPLFKGKQQAFGVLPLVAGTLTIAGISALISIPLGLMAAIYLSEY